MAIKEVSNSKGDTPAQNLEISGKMNGPSSENIFNEREAINPLKKKMGCWGMLKGLFKKKKTLDNDDDKGKIIQKAQALEEKEPQGGFFKRNVGEMIRGKWKKYLAATATVVSIIGLIYGFIFQPIVFIVIILLNAFAGFCYERYMMYKEKIRQEGK